MRTVNALIKSSLCAASFAAVNVSAHAALFARPGGMVYDSDQNITWLADWNYAKTSGFDADGRMDWTTASDWAALLVGPYKDAHNRSASTLSPVALSCRSRADASSDRRGDKAPG